MSRPLLAVCAALLFSSCAKVDDAADIAYLDSQASLAVPVTPMSMLSLDLAAADRKITFLYDVDRMGGRDVKLIMAYSEARALKPHTVFVVFSAPQLLRAVLADAAADGVVFDPVDGRRPRVVLKGRLAGLLGKVRSRPDHPFVVEVAKEAP